jgi:hypothetical protein
VPALRATVPHLARVAPGGQVKLEVKGAAKGPVTFYSPDGGVFCRTNSTA